MVFATVSPGSGSRGITAFVVERGDDGFTTGPPLPKMGSRCFPAGELFFEECFLPDDRRIGEEGKGFRGLMRFFDRARVQLSDQGVTVRAMAEPAPQRRAFCFVDGAGERTITVLGEKLRPSGADSRLPWHELAGVDAARPFLLDVREPWEFSGPTGRHAPGAHLIPLQQVPRRASDLLDGRVERLGVALRRRAETAHLADVLKGRRGDLVVGRPAFGAAECLDGTAHPLTLTLLGKAGHRA